MLAVDAHRSYQLHLMLFCVVVGGVGCHVFWLWWVAFLVWFCLCLVVGDGCFCHMYVGLVGCSCGCMLDFFPLGTA